MRVDRGAPAGITEQYLWKLEQQRGIPVWIRVGLEGPLLLVGHIEPEDGTPAQMQMARFFKQVGDALAEYEDG